MRRIIIALALFWMLVPAKANTADSLQVLKNYEAALAEIEQMLTGEKQLDFERAIFTIENAYWDNNLSYDLFRKTIDAHVRNIQKLMEANDRSDTMDFEVKLDMSKPIHHSGILYSAEEKKEMYRKALANWAIYTYLKDTTYISNTLFRPFIYNINDPFGLNDWRNTQVNNLLISKSGNCFALVSLYKILSNRLKSEAKINTAPGHIYIQHEDHKGDKYNVELASGTHPSDGSIQTLTYTFLDGMQKGVCMRQLDEKQIIALCAVTLGKSFSFSGNDFPLECAELALKYDSKNLNALLIKHQILGNLIINYSTEVGIKNWEDLKVDPAISSEAKKLEDLTLFLFDHGYYQMPLDMQKTILAGLKHDGNNPIFVEDKTPKAFESLNVDEKDKRYSTLSGGLFEEVKEDKRYELYGNFVLDTKERRISTVDFSASKELLIDPVAFAWQIDPLAHEFPSWSPYAAFADNPIYFTDPDGRSVRPTNSKAQQVLSASFDNALGMFPEIRERVRMKEVGTRDGQAVQAYVFDAGRNEGGTAMSISKARSIIKKSNLTNEQKLTALSYLNAVNQTDVFEFQVAYNPETDQSFGVMTQNSSLAESAYKSRQEGDNSDVIKDASASFEGEASYNYFFNEKNTPINVKNSNYPIQVIGLYNALPTNETETQSVMNEIMYDMSGGAALFDDGYKHSVDENGNFSSKKLK